MLNNEKTPVQPGEVSQAMMDVLKWMRHEEEKHICVPDVIKAVRHCKMSLTREAGDPFCEGCPYNRNHVPGERICDRKLLEDVYSVLLDQSDSIVDLWWRLNHMDDEEESDDAE